LTSRTYTCGRFSPTTAADGNWRFFGRYKTENAREDDENEEEMKKDDKCKLMQTVKKRVARK